MRLFFLVLFLLAPTLAHAQYPTKPVRMVVPFPAGGATDVLARVIAQKAADKLGNSIIVENAPGAGGTLGADRVAKAAPDGYTILIATSSTHSIGPTLNPKIPYDVVRDFVPIIHLANSPNLLVVPAQFAANDVQGLIKLAKAAPGKLNYASSGNGTIIHLTTELFKQQANVYLTHIPYRGSALAIPDMVSGQIQILFDSFVTALPHLKDGKLKALGITSLARSPLLPNLPTLDEQGLKGFESNTWFGLYAPRGTALDVVQKLNVAFNDALKDKDLGERLSKLGADAVGSTPAQFGAMVATDTQKWAKLIRERKITGGIESGKDKI